MTQLDRKRFKDELASHEPVPSPELVAKAEEAFKIAMRSISLSSAVIENRIAMLCDPIFSSAIDTLAVTAKPGTGILLAINPQFFLERLDDDGRQFGLVHEGSHVEKKHLLTEETGDAWTIACEVLCNHDTMATLGTPMLTAHPVLEDGTVDSTTKEEFGVNPRKIWEQYRKDLKEQEVDHVDYRTFTSTDLVCFAELKKMTSPPKPPRSKSGVSKDGENGWGCEHHGKNDLPFDQEEIDEAMKDVLDNAARKAGPENNRKYKDALEKLFKQTKGDEKADKIWGDLGVGELFGAPTQKRQVQFWAQWLRRQLGSRLVPGRQLVFNRRTVAVDHQLRRDPILAYRGKKRRSLLWVEVDTSGSMSYAQLEWVQQYIGDDKDVDVQFHSFDTEQYELEPGEQFSGRGGTNFHCIENAYKETRRKPDAVVVLTDGYAQHISPSDKKKWIWLITDGGDDWPAKDGMACFKLPPPS